MSCRTLNSLSLALEKLFRPDTYGSFADIAGLTLGLGVKYDGCANPVEDGITLHRTVGCGIFRQTL